MYNYYVGTPSNISTLVSNLDYKLSIDLDLSTNYVSTVYNSTSQNVEITYSSPLSEYLLGILNNLTDIILYNMSVTQDVYVVNNNQFNRRSFNTILSPSINNDINSGYTPGSIVSTNDNVYYCTDNTPTNATWITLSTTGPTGIQGPTGPTGIQGPTGTITTLSQLGSTGTYSWVLSRNVTYVIGTTLPTTNLVCTLSPVVNDNWVIANDALKYIGIPTININYMVCLNYKCAASTKVYQFVLTLNGNPIANTTITNTNINTNNVPISYTKMLTVSTNDILSVSVLCSSSGGDTMTLNYYTLTVWS